MIDLTHILTLDVKKHLGEKVKQCRKRYGISQFELAERIEMSETAIAMLERGERWPRFETLQAIADTVGVTVDAFFASEIVVVKPTPQEALEIIKKAIERPAKLSAQDYLAQALSALDEEKAAKYLELIALQNPATPALKDLFLSFSKRPDRAKKSSHG